LFPIWVVPPGAVEETETMGTKRKFWYEDAQLGRCLFKYSREHAGEDWAEKVAEQLCSALSLPHARYELAEFAGDRGVVSPRFLSEEEALVAGNQLLVAVDPTYPAEANRARLKVPQHTIGSVAKVLQTDAIELPPETEYPAPVRDAWDVFIGYLLLDALIGNTDRHHENWAVVDAVTPSGRVRRLAPTHDHGSSLGRNESEDRLRARLETNDSNQTPEAYANRCVSKLYLDATAKKPLGSLEAFAAASRLNPPVADAWLVRLENLASPTIDAIFEQLPASRITPVAAEFAKRLLRHNRSRLLASRGSFQ
jgi:hypothetical protein